MNIRDVYFSFLIDQLINHSNSCPQCLPTLILDLTDINEPVKKSSTVNPDMLHFPKLELRILPTEKWNILASFLVGAERVFLFIGLNLHFLWLINPWSFLRRLDIVKLILIGHIEFDSYVDFELVKWMVEDLTDLVCVQIVEHIELAKL